MINWKNIFIAFVVIALTAGLGICLFISATSELTSKESLMLGILVTIFSILISWILTHVYSQINLVSTTEDVKKMHAENIQTYAVKAAEKVFNLSNELNRLSENLKGILEDYEGEENIDVANLVYRERINLTIHLVETLKSMNDTFLSDWKGVIGDQIQQQQYLENQINEIAVELEKQKRIKEQLEEQFISVEEIEGVQKSIEDTEKRLEQKMAQLPFGIKPVIKMLRKKDITVTCPNCESKNNVTIKPRKGAKKIFQCNECLRYSRLSFHNYEDFIVNLIQDYEFKVICPLCKKEFSDNIPSFSGATRKLTCPNCELDIAVHKTKGGVNVTSGYAKKIPQGVLESVLTNLPPQPWPKGMHKEVASKLGLTNSVVSRAIQRLIKEGKIEALLLPENISEENNSST